jgi:hypothetical protein
VPGWEREAAPCVGLARLEDPGDGLVLEPLADVARVGSRRLRQLGRGRGAAGAQRLVEPEAVAEVDGVDVVEAEDGAEEPLDERVPRRVAYARRS